MKINERTFLQSLSNRGFFTALGDLVFPFYDRNKCRKDFRLTKQALKMCRFAESDWSDVIVFLRAEGAECDCSVIFHVALCFANSKRRKATKRCASGRTSAFEANAARIAKAIEDQTKTATVN